MFANNLIKVAGLLVIIALGWYLWAPLTGMNANAHKEHPPVKEAIPSPVSETTDFNGKILLVRYTGSDTFLAQASIEQAKVRKLGNRLFLVGKGVDLVYGEWAKGRTIWCALDLIGEIDVFDNLEQAKKIIPPLRGVSDDLPKMNNLKPPSWPPPPPPNEKGRIKEKGK